MDEQALFYPPTRALLLALLTRRSARLQERLMTLNLNPAWVAGYIHLRPIGDGEVKASVQVSEDLLVDLDADRKVIGIEVLGHHDWRDALAQLAMAGRLTVPDKGDLWPIEEGT